MASVRCGAEDAPLHVEWWNTASEFLAGFVQSAAKVSVSTLATLPPPRPPLRPNVDFPRFSFPYPFAP